jgi:type I restriction enzyme S subunit
MTGSRATQTGGRAATTGQIPGDCAIGVGMPDEETAPGWNWRLLTDLARLETGHTPSRRHPEYWDGDIPWIGIRDATANHGRTLLDTEQHVTQAGIDNSSARLLPANTVCLSRTASVGYVVVMGRPMATSQDFVNWVCNPESLDYRYLKYALLAERTSYSRFAHGTTHQTIYFPEVKAFHLLAPAREKQSTIADVLSALDDKIEQNWRAARASERLTRATFRAWFVDFEPVKAKVGGAPAFPSMPQAVFDALPTQFVESDIGPVPEGWEVRPLSDCVHLTMGQSPPSEHYNQSGDGLPFHQGVTHYGFRFPTHRVYCTVESRVAHPGDVLLSVRAPVGRINVADRRLVIGRGIAALRHLRDRRSFLLHQLAHVFAEEDAVGDGTIYKAVTKQFLSAMSILSPPEDAQAAFETIARPLDDLVASSEVETRRLAAMRDYLLPKLLTGQVRVAVGDV